MYSRAMRIIQYAPDFPFFRALCARAQAVLEANALMDNVCNASLYPSRLCFHSTFLNPGASLEAARYFLASLDCLHVQM
jgi:hypothetical protein